MPFASPKIEAACSASIPVKRSPRWRRCSAFARSATVISVMALLSMTSIIAAQVFGLALELCDARIEILIHRLRRLFPRAYNFFYDRNQPLDGITFRVPREAFAGGLVWKPLRHSLHAAAELRFTILPLALF